jgi:hypothetical protein
MTSFGLATLFEMVMVLVRTAPAGVAVALDGPYSADELGLELPHAAAASARAAAHAAA